MEANEQRILDYFNSHGAVYDPEDDFVYLPEALYNQIQKRIAELRENRKFNELKEINKLQELNKEIDDINTKSMAEENRINAEIDKYKQINQEKLNKLNWLKEKIKVLDEEWKIKEKRRVNLSTLIEGVQNKLNEYKETYNLLEKRINDNKKVINSLKRKINEKRKNISNIVMKNEFTVRGCEEEENRKEIESIKESLKRFKCPNCNYKNMSIYVSSICNHLGFCDECFQKLKSKKKPLKCPRCDKESNSYYSVYFPQ